MARFFSALLTFCILLGGVAEAGEVADVIAELESQAVFVEGKGSEHHHHHSANEQTEVGESAMHDEGDCAQCCHAPSYFTPSILVAAAPSFGQTTLQSTIHQRLLSLNTAPLLPPPII